MLNLVSLIITGLFKNISLSRLKSTYLLESGLYPGGQVFGSFGSKPEGQVPGLLGSKFDLPPLGLFSSKLDEELPRVIYRIIWWITWSIYRFLFRIRYILKLKYYLIVQVGI
ncbi:hypothetical protein HYD76_00890 [Mycoplasmopsis bovis]|nr:hypothetical protein [Mycoplasmopsis bovis]QQH42763.1 hypothetical protein HYD80_00945 [Mycoplasmopsis bovis]QQH48598.1 hypothetical protein HYD76_00890 [Mycoplasmopsis bovis]